MKITNYIRVIQQKDKYLRSYYVLAMLRIFLVFVPQFGYIHPDEFFQSLEVMAGDEYGLEHTRTWEFNQTFPIRSIAMPYLTIKIPLNFLRFITMYVRYYFQLDLNTTYVLLVYPRLLMATLSFVNDWSMYRICKSYGLKYEIRLLALASSYIMLVFGSRTFSNTIEMSISSLLLYIVAECMVHSNTIIFQMEFLQEKYAAAKSTVEKVKIYKLRTQLPTHSLNKCILIASICVLGVFNRPTFFAFGMPVVFFWLLRGMGTKTTTFVDFNIRVAMFLVSALPALLVLILIDSLYYGYLSLAEIHNLQITIDNFVVTPLNFIRYNINPENTAKHGAHPKYLHLLVNIPLLYNILGIVTICSFGMMIYRFAQAEYRNLPRAQSVVTLMTSSIFVPITILSLINHQEPRFLLPLTLPIILLHGPKLQNGLATRNPFTPEENRIGQFIYKHFLSSRVTGSGYLLRYWYLINILMTVFFGFIHQGGVVQLVNHLSYNFRSYQPYQHHHRSSPYYPNYPSTQTPPPPTSSQNINIHLVTSHIYNIPTSLFFLPSSQTMLTNPETGQKYRRTKRLYLYEYGDMDMDSLYKKIKLILDVCEMKVTQQKQKEQQQQQQQQAAFGGDGNKRRPLNGGGSFLDNNHQRYQLYLAIPSSLAEELSLAFWRSNTTIIKHERVKVFYPHLSTEAMPKIFMHQHPAEIKMNFNQNLILNNNNPEHKKCLLYDTIDNYDDLFNNNDGDGGVGGYGDEDETTTTTKTYTRKKPEDLYSIGWVLKKFSSLVHQFGLALYRIDVDRNRSFVQ